MIDVKKYFSARLKELRIQKSLTQQQVGELAGTDKKAVHTWEKGLHAPSIEIFCTLADYFQVSLDYLTGRSDEP